MKSITYVFFVLLSTNIGASTTKLTNFKTCKDCLYLEQCPSAEYSEKLEISYSEYIKKLKKAYCGYDTGIKICCSEFDKDAVKTHANIGLLPDNCGPIHGNRIYGGKVASLYEFPWMALISYQTDDGPNFQCAGSIINSRYILTAAHCIRTNRNIIGVRVGDFDLRHEYDCQELKNGKPICENHYQDIRVKETIYHENYKEYPLYSHDIGLLRLEDPIDFTHKNTAPVCLPTSKELRTASIANKIATVAGWGLTERKKLSSVLLKIDIPVHPDDQCVNFYSRILESSASGTRIRQFCAGSYHKDSCTGDSGAPLIIEDQYKGVPSSIQYGIVSQGPKNCGSRSPGIYTSVSSYVDWILDKLKP